jgi:hypothetical protein
MVIMVSIPRQKYRYIRSHLFKSHKEEGCFLFVDSQFQSGVINLVVKEVHLLKNASWHHQSEYHLELKEEEKVKVMLKARSKNLDLIECHSHLFAGVAKFSHSDNHGLGEFVKYVWWKLPGKIYGALVWTETDIAGEVWLPKKNEPLPIKEIRIIS